MNRLKIVFIPLMVIIFVIFNFLAFENNEAMAEKPVKLSFKEVHNHVYHCCKSGDCRYCDYESGHFWGDPDNK